VHYLDDGEEIDFSTPEGVGSNYIAWLKTELRVCAKGVGLTYEQFTGDLTGVNYTSIRAGVIEFRRSIEQVQYHLYAFRFYRKISSWFVDAAIMSGVVNIENYWDDPSEHLPTFKAQGWDHVDPLKDRTADLLDARAGFNSRRNIIDSRGGDYDDIDRELIEDAISDLILDSIPAKTTKTGILQGTLAEEEPEEDIDDFDVDDTEESDNLDKEGEDDVEK
jgi:lambda family phage portal protein